MVLLSNSSDAAYNLPLNPVWLQTGTRTDWWQKCRARPSVQLKMCYWPAVCRWLFTFAPRIMGRRPITQGRCTALRARMSDRRNVHSNLPLSLSWFAAFHIHCNVNTETAAGSLLFVTIARAKHIWFCNKLQVTKTDGSSVFR